MQGRDLGRDLRERALRLDPLRETLVGILRGVIEARIAQDDCRMAGERGQELRILGVER